MNKSIVIVCAHSIYPHVKSSEGIVNLNWCEIMQNSKNCSFILMSSNKTINTKVDNIFFIEQIKSTILDSIYNYQKAPKSSIKGIAYKVGNFCYLKIRKKANYNSLYELIWTKIQSYNLEKALLTENRIVLWSRILPTLSLLPVITIYEKNQFPLIVNINDPLDTDDSDILTNEEITFLKTLNIASCWTFPSFALAKSMAHKYNLDLDKCFVIPHAMKDCKELYSFDSSKTGRIKIVYTGTFYRSAFTDDFGDNLLKFCSTENSQKVDFIFVLSQYDTFSIDWIKKNIPNAEIHLNISRDNVLKITQEADCMLIVDSVKHYDLLKGKLIEAISQGLPIFSITYPDSVMDKITLEYGGFAAYQNIQDDIFNKFVALTDQLKNVNWQQQFYDKRKKVIDKVSEKNIAELTENVVSFAIESFLYNKGISTIKPIIKEKNNWP